MDWPRAAVQPEQARRVQRCTVVCGQPNERVDTRCGLRSSGPVPRRNVGNDVRTPGVSAQPGASHARRSGRAAAARPPSGRGLPAAFGPRVRDGAAITVGSAVEGGDRERLGVHASGGHPEHARPRPGRRAAAHGVRRRAPPLRTGRAHPRRRRGASDGRVACAAAASKTDQEARGTVKALPYGRDPATCPPCAYVRWRQILLAGTPPPAAAAAAPPCRSSAAKPQLRRAVGRGGRAGAALLAQHPAPRTRRPGPAVVPGGAQDRRHRRPGDVGRRDRRDDPAPRRQRGVHRCPESTSRPGTAPR